MLRGDRGERRCGTRVSWGGDGAECDDRTQTTTASNELLPPLNEQINKDFTLFPMQNQ